MRRCNVRPGWRSGPVGSYGGRRWLERRNSAGNARWVSDLYVVMVAPECAPAAKAGGLGDVVSGLSRELELRGNAVEIILPKYASMRYSDIRGLQASYRDLRVPWHEGAVRCTVWFGYVNGRKCFFIEPHSAAGFFGRDRLYGYWRRRGAVRVLFQGGARVHAAGG